MNFCWQRAALLSCVLLMLTACSGPGGIGRTGPSPIEEQLLAEIALERGDYQTAVNKYLNVARASRDVEYAGRATSVAWDYGFDAHALAAAKRWVELAPRDESAHSYRVRLATRFGQLEDALASAEIALGPVEERQEQAYVALAADLLIAPRQGLQLFRQLEARYPQSPGIKRSLAELAAQAGDVAGAIAYARQTIALRPDWDTTRVWLARLLLANGERSSAFEQMAFALETNPGVEFELEFVRLMASAGEIAGAADRLERVSERYPEEAAVVLVGAELLADAGRDTEAEALYRRLINNGSCFSECYWNLGGLAFAQRNYAEAADFWRVVGAGSRQQSAVLGRSQAWQLLGDTDTALAVLDDFAADYPKRRFTILAPRAALLTFAGRHAEAIESTALALEYRPWNEALWLAHGAALEQGGQLDKALDAFRTAWELAPDSATAQNAYGYTLTIATDNYAEAEKLIARALDQETDNPAIMDSMGWVLYKQGRVSEAKALLTEAYGLLADPEIAAHLVELLWTTGERAAARELLDEAIQQFPESDALAAVREKLQ